MDPLLAIREGAAILEPAVAPFGFKFTLRNQGQSSGGHFAQGEFRIGDRGIEFHFRHSLGLVAYHDGDSSLTHEQFLRGLGVWGQNHYPGFTDDPLEPFRQLRKDLEEFAGDFLRGETKRFKTLAAQYAESESGPSDH